MCRQSRDRPIGLGKAQPFGQLPGDARLVEGIEQRPAILLSRQDPSKQSVKRRRCVGLDHGITLLAGLAWGRLPASATRFPGGIPSTRWLPGVLSDSRPRSIALAPKTRG